MARESSYSECDDGKVREPRAPLAGSNNSEVAISCDLAPNQIFENSDRGGEISKEKSPLRLCEVIISDTRFAENSDRPLLEFPDHEKISA
jgi:hypothetical protein